MTPRVRAARPGDLASLVALEAVFPTDRIDRRAFRRAIASASIDCAVIEAAGEVAGYGMIHRRAGLAVARLTSLAIDPARTGRGLGRALLAALEVSARRGACTRLRLEVRADNARALALYRRSGYRQIAAIGGYYSDGATALRLEKDLFERA